MVAVLLIICLTQTHSLARSNTEHNDQTTTSNGNGNGNGNGNVNVNQSITTSLPLDLAHPSWQQLHYSNIKPNRLSQTSEALHLHINHSASPLIYLFDQTVTVQSITARGRISALPSFSKGNEQGQKGADDFAFRWGLVVAGDKTLSRIDALLAPDWVKQLHSLASKASPAIGIDGIVFFNLANSPAPPWTERQHPNGKGLISERIVGELDAAGEFHLKHTLTTPLTTLAFWFSSDGDNSNSQYDLSLTELSFQHLP